MDYFDYLAKIAEADNLEELDSILDEASFDDWLSNKEYEDLYGVGLHKAKGFLPVTDY